MLIYKELQQTFPNLQTFSYKEVYQQKGGVGWRQVGISISYSCKPGTMLGAL